MLHTRTITPFTLHLIANSARPSFYRNPRSSADGSLPNEFQQSDCRTDLTFPPFNKDAIH
ncbi:hypothetical protein T03_15833 [Trichinella britovi]|uniref:Uncharacterized protein n=1 Tax=Trichinella britovi TaxID=45882 RepID=A0A0V1C9A0_TRIBR|nr:hypothetical protein T03_15833 [Trichinella britovi]